MKSIKHTQATMTKEEFKAIRKELRLSTSSLGYFLSVNGRHICSVERGIFRLTEYNARKILKLKEILQEAKKQIDDYDVTKGE